MLQARSLARKLFPLANFAGSDRQRHQIVRWIGSFRDEFGPGCPRSSELGGPCAFAGRLTDNVTEEHTCCHRRDRVAA